MKCVSVGGVVSEICTLVICVGLIFTSIIVWLKTGDRENDHVIDYGGIYVQNETVFNNVTDGFIK